MKFTPNKIFLWIILAVLTIVVLDAFTRKQESEVLAKNDVTGKVVPKTWGEAITLSWLNIFRYTLNPIVAVYDDFIK